MFSKFGFDPPEVVETSSCPDAFQWLKDQAAGQALSQELRNKQESLNLHTLFPTCPQTGIFISPGPIR
jgi:hypothetical protein